jgi:hypothetical protein
MNAQEAIAVWRDILSSYEGRFSKDPVDGALAFDGKDGGGHEFRATIRDYGDRVSVGCEYLEDSMGHYGCGCPCHTVGKVKQETEHMARSFRMKRKEFEQLRLW